MYLDKIIEQTVLLVKERKNECSLEKMKELALNCTITGDFKFFNNLKKEGLSFICEVKKASPSKGLISPNFPYIEIAKQYEQSGAAAISVLTEPFFFQGDVKYVTEISENVKTPILRKDFTIDEYQIYKAKVIGADAILLISEILEETQIRKFLEIAESLGLSVLVESHSEFHLKKALSAGAKIVGVNNRNLETFEVDFNTSLNLRKLVPQNDDYVFVSESGITSADEIKILKDAGADAVLIGEQLMRANNINDELNNLRRLL